LQNVVFRDSLGSSNAFLRTQAGSRYFDGLPHHLSR